VIKKFQKVAIFILALAGFTPISVLADSISPDSFNDSLSIGYSVTIRKTVTISGEPAFAAEVLTPSFGEYSQVTVDDLGGGLPGIDVMTSCVSADIGSCSGATANGVFDRFDDRTFEFDVTFTALQGGVHIFDTYALVDGDIVALENDSITVVPVPPALWLFGSGLLGLVGMARRKA
jgi:hypothetical protein